MTTTFSINFDYRCPFARNANEHILAAVDDGGPYDVAFRAFSLNEAHRADDEMSIFEQLDHRPDLVALAAGVVVREHFPAKFAATHVGLFSARHDDGLDLREERVIRGALEKAGVASDAVYAELDAGWPFELIAKEHGEAASAHDVFGVPTFVVGGRAAFVRVMSRPRNAEHARSVVDHVLSLLVEHDELNEFKHTTIAY